MLAHGAFLISCIEAESRPVVAKISECERDANQAVNGIMPPMRIALLFPGQGSQVVGMGQDLAAASAAAADILARADAAFGGGLATLLATGPQDLLTRTTNAQPALLTVSTMAWAALREALPDLTITAAAGHSLGEFSALTAAGALTLEEAVPLVRDRGAYMQEAVPVGEGAMAACLAEAPAVEALVAAVQAEGVHGVLALANFNGPGQVVISGSAAAVERARLLAAEHGIRKVIPLDVSAPFHSPLMQPAQERFAVRFATVTIHPLAFPIVTNLEATPNQDAARVHDLGIRQITAPVRWTACCDQLLALGCDTFIELGAGSVLSNMLKRGWKDHPVTCHTTVDAAALTATIAALRETAHV